jgi:hypothetical protein
MLGIDAQDRAVVADPEAVAKYRTVALVEIGGAQITRSGRGARLVLAERQGSDVHQQHHVR